MTPVSQIFFRDKRVSEMNIDELHKCIEYLYDDWDKLNTKVTRLCIDKVDLMKEIKKLK